MNLSICGYDFDGFYSTPDELQEKAGVLVVLCFFNGELYRLNSGESTDIKSTCKQMLTSCEGTNGCSFLGFPLVLVHYTENRSKAERLDILAKLDQQKNVNRFSVEGCPGLKKRTGNPVHN